MTAAVSFAVMIAFALVLLVASVPVDATMRPSPGTAPTVLVPCPCLITATPPAIGYRVFVVEVRR